MKCVGCGIDMSFEWPGGDDTKVKALWEAVYEGPLCKVCSGESPMRALVDGQEPSEQFCYALRRHHQIGRDGFDFQSLFDSQADGSQNLDDVEDL